VILIVGAVLLIGLIAWLLGGTPKRAVNERAWRCLLGGAGGTLTDRLVHGSLHISGSVGAILAVFVFNPWPTFNVC